MDANTTPLKLKAALAAARGVLVVEAVWPALFAALLVAAGFLALVWFGVLTWLPDLLRFIVIGIFALAFLAALARLLRVRLPGEAAARRRLERDSGLDHAPLSTLADAPAGTDPVAHALFAEHRKRVLSGLKRLMPALPHSAVPRRDPLALRTPVLLLALVAALYAGPDRGARLAEAFRGWTPEESVPVRIDAWLAPPGYTARPPLVLIAATPDPQRFGERIEVPEGTLLVLRMSVADALATSVTGATEEEGTPGERRFRLMRDGALELGTGTPLARFVFAVRPDADPAIAFADAPGATEDGALSMRVLFEDDYGVTGAEAAMIFDLDARAAMLVEPPAIDLVLPANRRNGAAQTVRDLTAHPFAGLSVPMRLIARDAAENTATSAVETVFIPERRWREPLAHALVEQRRGLALDRTAQGQVVLALDALMTGAANFMADDTGTFLALRVVRSRLLRARSDDELRGVLDDLWDLAVTIEDGAVGLAAERLRQLQEQLAEALENNLPPDTIDALMEEMRQALSDFLQSL